MSASPAAAPAWPDAIFAVLNSFDVRQVSYVPDAGHAQLIRRVHEEPTMRGIVLTTEEEGVGLSLGAWLGGQRSVLLMQSSGVGNCGNMLSLIRMTRCPFLALVTMRGEWGEFNPWQVPMGLKTEAALRLMDVHVLRADAPEDAADAVTAAAVMAYEAETPTAVLLGQRLIGAKVFAK
jgi:sulfopyruvate decarboxylase alpha subunit